MKKFLVPAMLALLLLTTGCDKTPPENSPAEPPAKPVQSKTDVKPEDKSQPSKPASESEKAIKPVEENLPAKNEKTEQSLNVRIYYPDDSGMRLVEVEREIIVDDSVDKYTAAVEALLEEPDEENLTKIFPSSAGVRSVTVKGDLAIVDLDGLKNFVGGSTGEEFLVGSVVDTLTNFPEIKRVKILVQGREIETLSGHMDLSTPLERMNSLIE